MGRRSFARLGVLCHFLEKRKMAHVLRIIARNSKVLSTRSFSTSLAARTSTKVQSLAATRDEAYPKLGNREIVGFGVNGTPTYVDMEEYPAPAVRFKEDSPEVMALREKEKGDWKALSLEEKKALYRASFCQTFSEMKAPTGEWKVIVAGVLFGLCITAWIMVFLKKYVYPTLPPTFTKEWREAQVEMMIKQRQGPVEGVASKWDYEKNEWK